MNIFEDFESTEALNAWRAMAPSPAATFEIKHDQVLKHLISTSGPPSDRPDADH